MIGVGIGGWTFEPWRGTFYPEDLRQADELSYAASKLTAIEVNGTYYSSQKPETFAKWAASVPDGFIFTLKASRFCTNRKVLGEAGESIGKFVGQGIAELGDRLGPILWQLAPTKKFDPVDIEAFLSLLPVRVAGLRLRHCIEARHASFADPQFVALCRKAGVAVCVSQDERWPLIPDVTTGFVYARLMEGDEAHPTGYELVDIEAWAGRIRTYAAGGRPGDLAPVAPIGAPVEARDVFAFFVHGGKVRAPAAAMALIDRLKG